MKFTRTIATSTLAAGVAAAGLFGLGMGTANANPGQPCGGPGPAICQPNPGPNNNAPVNQRGIVHVPGPAGDPVARG
jgi:hypothetical protein